MKAHLPKRITSWFVSFFLFIIASLILIFYATGFSYDFKNNKIVKTGIIYLTINPDRDLEILVDGRALSAKSPAKLSYLVPGEHKITIKKQGYNDWSKVYNVQSGKVISDYNITLFLKEPETDLIAKDIRGFYLSKDKNKTVYWTKDNNLFIAGFDSIIKNKKQVAQNISNVESFSWSANQDKAVFMANNNWHLLDFNKQSISDLNLINSQSTNVQIINNKIFYTLGNNLYFFDLDKKQSQNVSSNTYGFIDFKNSIIASIYDGQNFCLVKINADNYKIKDKVCSKNKFVKIKNIENSILALDEIQNLYKLENSFKLISISEQVTDFTWSHYARAFFSSRGKTGVYYYNDLGEFYFYSYDENKNYFITRLGKNVDCLTSYLNGDILMFSSENELYTLDGSGVNQYKIADISNTYYSLTKDQEKILILSPSNNLELLKIR